MIAYLRRIMPDSLFKQISLTLLACIGLLFLVNMGVVYFIQTHFLGMLEEERSANIASMYLLLANNKSAQENEGLARITRFQSSSRYALTFHLIQEAPNWGKSKEPLTEQAVDTLKNILTENAVAPLPAVYARIFWEGDDFQIDTWAKQVSGSAPVCSNPLLQMAVQLNEENWLNITQPLYKSAAWLIWVQRFVFLFEFAIFSFVVLLLLRRLLKPFQQLTQAAEIIGKQPEIASPVPEDGCREIREAAQAFNRMQARIRNNLLERDRMLAAMAHDLRTPLTRVQLRIEEVTPEPLREKLTEGIKEIRSIAEQGLELSRSLTVSEKTVPLDILAFMQSCVDDFAEMGHKVSLNNCHEAGAAPLAVMVSPLSLKRCVDNIVHNAVTYAGSAEVCVSSSTDTVVIDICDNGPGIPEEYLERIFEPYFRLETSRNRESGGTGLGLSIARNMVLLNNGTLRLENRAQGGLQVSILLPRLKRD